MLEAVLQSYDMTFTHFGRLCHGISVGWHAISALRCPNRCCHAGGANAAPSMHLYNCFTPMTANRSIFERFSCFLVHWILHFKGNKMML